ncbi:testican-3, partial [Plakobranchus ocellatus]
MTSSQPRTFDLDTSSVGSTDRLCVAVAGTGWLNAAREQLDLGRAEAQKKSKLKWEEKKYGKSLLTKGDVDLDLDQSHVMDTNKKHLSWKAYGNKQKKINKSGRWTKKWRKGRRGKYHKKSKKARRNKYNPDKITKRMPWMMFLSEADCEMKCDKKEICMNNPLEAKPVCVHFKDLKKSMKLFRKYQKKEKKAWHKFHKDNSHHLKQTDDVFKTEKVKQAPVDDKLALQEALKKKDKMIKSAEKSWNKAPGALFPSKAEAPKECETSDFSQMRTRIMGWFHLLRSQKKGLMKGQRKHKAHKHSVKKQLEAGDSCQCMKSAMYEFHQMDQDGDDQLNERETAILEGNSMEPCMKPYLRSCDHNADGVLSSAEWCCCFANV